MTRDGYRAAMSVAMLLVTLAVDAKHQEQLEVLMSDNAFINVTRHKARAVGHSFDSDVAPPPVPLSVAAQTVATPSAISQHSTTAAVTALATIEPASRASPAALGVNSPEADPKSPSQQKKTKKKKKKAPPSPAPPPEQEQDKDDSWLSKDGRLTPVGASVWFAGGSVIGGLVLLLALRPPWGSRKEPAKKEAAAGGCTDGS